MTHYFLIRTPVADEELWGADMLFQKNGLRWLNFRKGIRLKKEQVQEPIIVELDHLEGTKKLDTHQLKIIS